MCLWKAWDCNDLSRRRRRRTPREEGKCPHLTLVLWATANIKSLNFRLATLEDTQDNRITDTSALCTHQINPTHLLSFCTPEPPRNLLSTPTYPILDTHHPPPKICRKITHTTSQVGGYENTQWCVTPIKRSADEV